MNREEQRSANLTASFCDKTIYFVIRAIEPPSLDLSLSSTYDIFKYISVGKPLMVGKILTIHCEIVP